jgi:hypothetical protein
MLNAKRQPVQRRHTTTANAAATTCDTVLPLLLLHKQQLSVARLQEGRLTAGERGALEGRLCAAQSESHALAADVLRLTEAAANEAELRATAEDTAAQATAKVAELTAKVLPLRLQLLLLVVYGYYCFFVDVHTVLLLWSLRSLWQHVCLCASCSCCKAHVSYAPAVARVRCVSAAVLMLAKVLSCITGLVKCTLRDFCCMHSQKLTGAGAAAH